VINLQSGHGPRALVTLHSAICPECQRYLRVDLASSAGRLGEWGGRLGVVVPGQVGEANELAQTAMPTMQVLEDPKRQLASGGRW
jgi:hypothetical protein